MNKNTNNNDKGLLDKAKDKAKDTVNYVKSGEMTKDAKEKLSQAKDKIGQGYDITKQKVNQGVNAMKDGVNKVGEKMKEGYNKVTNNDKV